MYYKSEPKMDGSKTITVSELIEILKLQDPNGLISFDNEYTIPNRSWDSMYMFSDTKRILTVQYEHGKLKKIEPNL